jgi:hypothetical protein
MGTYTFRRKFICISQYNIHRHTTEPKSIGQTTNRIFLWGSCPIAGDRQITLDRSFQINIYTNQMEQHMQ